jgi:hypothetical protein
MSAKLLTAPEREGTTFGLAIRILGALALGMIVLCCWAILIRFDGKPRTANSSWSNFIPPFSGRVEPDAGPVPLPASASATGLADGLGPAATPEPISPPSAPAFAGTPPLPLVAPAPVGSDPASALPAGSVGPGSGAAVPLAPEHPAHHIGNNVARALVEKALQMREQGDTQGCLSALKEAAGMEPEHPKILAELATTYYQIGQEAKSASYWESVHRMGPEKAGTYWDLSDMALKGELREDSAPVSDLLRVSRHFVRPVPGDSGKDQRMILRIQVEALTKEPLDSRRMYLQVFFYDMVNDTRFEQTIADTTPSYISAPYDWKDGEEEIIEVEYHLPELTPEQIAQLGHRQYFGYVIELYYHDVLQDLVAAPRKLARFGSATPAAARNEP